MGRGEFRVHLGGHLELKLDLPTFSFESPINHCQVSVFLQTPAEVSKSHPIPLLCRCDFLHISQVSGVVYPTCYSTNSCPSSGVSFQFTACIFIAELLLCARTVYALPVTRPSFNSPALNFSYVEQFIIFYYE